MSVDTARLRRDANQMREELYGQRATIMFAAADEIDALRAENVKLWKTIGNLYEQRRDLAHTVRDMGWTGSDPQDSCTGCGVYRRDLEVYRHFVECPFALAERVLAETVAAVMDRVGACENGQMGHNGCVNCGSASDMAQDGAHG